MMKRIDKGVILVIAVLLGCVCVKSALEAAASLIVPVMLIAAGYAGFRAWQTGSLGKILPKKAEAKKETP